MTSNLTTYLSSEEQYYRIQALRKDMNQLQKKQTKEINKLKDQLHALTNHDCEIESPDIIMEFIKEKIIVGGPNDRVKKVPISSLFREWYRDMYSKKSVIGVPTKLFHAIEKHFNVTYQADGWHGIAIVVIDAE